MPLSRWVLALADNGRSGGSAAALATVTSLPNLDERAIVAEAQAGNRAAFEELVRRYDRDVLRLALNLMKRPEDARDVYQEAQDEAEAAKRGIWRGSFERPADWRAANPRVGD